MSAGTGRGSDDDALPEGFTVPDDLSALFDAQDPAPARPASDDASVRPGGDPGAAPQAAVPAEDPRTDDATPGDGGARRAPGTRARADDAPGPAAGDASAVDAGADDGSADDAPDAAGAAVPDDLSSLTDPAAAEAPSVTLVLTQVAAAGPLAAACALAGVAVDVVPSPVGALAVLRDPRTGTDGAAAISKLLKTVPVILLERRSGQITATRWAGGQKGDELPAGLVLSDAPAVLEDLLLGGASVGDVEGVVTSVGLSRWKAMRMLAQSARGTRG